MNIRKVVFSSLGWVRLFSYYFGHLASAGRGSSVSSFLDVLLGHSPNEIFYSLTMLEVLRYE